MKKLTRLALMCLCCFIAAFSVIAVITADATATTSNILWTLAGSVSFVLAAVANPYRKPERA